MKHFLAVLLGTFTLLGIGIVLVIGPLANWIETFIHGDDDMNTIGKILLLGVYPALMLIGGWLGSALFRKYCSAKQT